MKIFLAPMEGVLDYILRGILTNIGGYDYCVTEFMRVTDCLQAPSYFFKYCPELNQNACTTAGTPVYFQLLGYDPDLLAQNALRAIELGAPGIDLNFGCPAKTVNRHGGGATLLKHPHRLYDIIQKVRQAVPEPYSVSAKIRLGYETPELALEIAKAAEEGGATWLTVHARTKKDGYRQPADWEWIARICEVVTLPVIANGDIWSVDDYFRCRDISGCSDVMLGRGAIASPDLALQIKIALAGKTLQPYSWGSIHAMILRFFNACRLHPNARYATCRVKQWTKHLVRTYPEASTLFDHLKREEDPDVIHKILLEAL